jgi:uncharacterized protein (TIGR01777 family)
MLVQRGHSVVHLGRTKKSGNVPSFRWDIHNGDIDEGVFTTADTVIHLAGAGVADKRWSASRKHEILESRTKSTALLARYIKKFPTIKTVVCASAIGYYGFNLSDEVFTEDSAAGNDFLAQVVKAWEDEADKIMAPRLVKLRIGIVLSEKGGALKEIANPVSWGVGAPLGTGNQHISWIHIDDLCRMFIKAVEDDSMQGVYNATGPDAVTNRKLTVAIARILDEPLWLPTVPPFVMNMLVGEMGEIVLNGSVVSSKKIQEAGFEFQYATLEKALENLLKDSQNS